MFSVYKTQSNVVVQLIFNIYHSSYILIRYRTITSVDKTVYANEIITEKHSSVLCITSPGKQVLPAPLSFSDYLYGPKGNGTTARIVAGTLRGCRRT